MTIPYHRYWALRRTGRGLRRSDPHLAAMLAIFTRLTAGEAIASWEQGALPGGRIRHVLTWLGNALVAAVAFLVACARCVLRRDRAAIAWAVVRCRFSRRAWTAASALATPRSPGDPGR